MTVEIEKELDNQVKYWKRTKDIATAWAICECLYNKLNSEVEDAGN